MTKLLTHATAAVAAFFIVTVSVNAVLTVPGYSEAALFAAPLLA